MKIKINKTTLIWFLASCVILKPMSIGYLIPAQIDKAWDYGRIIIAIILALYFVVLRYELRYMLELVMYQVFILAISMAVGGDVKACLIYMISYMELVMITIIGTHKKQVIYGTYISLSLFCIINFLAIVLAPYGLYINGREWQNWFLGYRSIHIIYLLPCMVLSSLYYQVNKNFLFKLIEVLCFLQPFMVWSAGEIVCVFIYEVLKTVNYKKMLLREGRLGLYTTIWVMINYFLTRGYLIESFRFAIVNLLHRNTTLTGRTTFWANFWAASMDSPVIGHGNLDNIITTLKYGAPYAHNFLLNLFYVGGIVAITLFLFVLIVYSFRLKRVEVNKELSGYVLLGVITFMLIALVESFEDMGAIPIIFTLLCSMYISKNDFQEIWRK